MDIIIQVADPYKYLEDPDCDETKQFVDNQNKITKEYIEACSKSIFIYQAFRYLAVVIIKSEAFL